MLFAVVIIILAGFTLYGYIRGMVRMVFSLVAIFLALGMTAWAAPHVSVFLENNTPLYGNIQEKCMEYIREKTEAKMEQGIEEQEPIRIAGIEIPQEFQELLSQKTVETADGILVNSGIYEEIADYVAGIVINVIACVLSFVIAVLVLQILVNLLDIVAKLPVLNFMNRLGGTFAGVVEGIIIVWILFLAIRICAASEWGQGLVTDIRQNVFLDFLDKNNVIKDIFEHVIRQ